MDAAEKKLFIEGTMSILTPYIDKAIEILSMDGSWELTQTDSDLCYEIAKILLDNFLEESMADKKTSMMMIPLLAVMKKKMRANGSLKT